MWGKLRAQQVSARLRRSFASPDYSRILPLVLREKAIVRHGGVATPQSERRETVFRPNVANRASAVAMETAAAVTQSLDRQLRSLSDLDAAPRSNRSGCAPPWRPLLNAVAAGVRFALARPGGGRRVAAAVSAIARNVVPQQRALGEMLGA